MPEGLYVIVEYVLVGCDLHQFLVKLVRVGDDLAVQFTQSQLKELKLKIGDAVQWIPSEKGLILRKIKG